MNYLRLIGMDPRGRFSVRSTHGECKRNFRFVRFRLATYIVRFLPKPDDQRGLCDAKESGARYYDVSSLHKPANADIFMSTSGITSTPKYQGVSLFSTRMETLILI